MERLSRRRAAAAIEALEPSIELWFKLHANRSEGHLRISAKIDGEWELLRTRDFGVRDEWEHLYEEVATSKELVSQRTGMSTREVQAIHRGLLQDGDTVYFGSAVSACGTIVVAFSGVQAYFDEMFCKWILAAYEALLEFELEKQKSEGAKKFAF